MRMPVLAADLISRAAGRFYYLASPYTSAHKHEQEVRTVAAVAVSGALMSAGIFVFSPIVQTHRAAQLFDLPGNFEWWIEYNRAFMDASAGTVVAVSIDGWQRSRGVAQEIAYTQAANKPVYEVILIGTEIILMQR